MECRGERELRQRESRTNLNSYLFSSMTSNILLIALGAMPGKVPSLSPIMVKVDKVKDMITLTTKYQDLHMP